MIALEKTCSDGAEVSGILRIADEPNVKVSIH
jgi:hypothetical protein